MRRLPDPAHLLAAHELAWQVLWDEFAVGMSASDHQSLALNLTRSTCCRRWRPSTPTSTRACRPAGCTARGIAGTCSGTSFLSTRSSPCGAPT